MMRWRGEGRRERRSGLQSLQLVWIQEPRNFMRVISGPCTNNEDVTAIWVD
jgi:hypothetical protein